MKAGRGFSLIEMIVFIVITGIASTAMLVAFQLILQKSPTSNAQTIAITLAQERMDLILGQRQAQGFSSFADPCNPVTGSSPSICTNSLGYTVTSSISALTISGDSNYKVITVTATKTGGTATATLKTLTGS